MIFIRYCNIFPVFAIFTLTVYHLYQSELGWGCSCDSRKESAEGPPAEGPPIGSPPRSPADFD